MTIQSKKQKVVGVLAVTLATFAIGSAQAGSQGVGGNNHLAKVTAHTSKARTAVHVSAVAKAATVSAGVPAPMVEGMSSSQLAGVSKIVAAGGTVTGTNVKKGTVTLETVSGQTVTMDVKNGDVKVEGPDGTIVRL
jgi:hypothetical protein